MSKINIHTIERNIVGCATCEEKSALLAWLDSNKANRDAYFRMKNIWDFCRIRGYSQSEIRHEWELFAKRFNTIELEAKQATCIISFIRPWMRYAASIAVAVGLTYVLALYVASPKQTTELVAQQVTYLKIIVPKGQRTQVILADSSRVWLNAETILEYPSDFNINNRSVILNGEACFQVAPSDIPFTVTADEVQITALGTHFNVRNYSTDDYVETALFEGAVKIQTNQEELIISPGEAVTFLRQLQTTEVRHVPNISNILAWNNNHLIIDSERFEDIARRLERWYDVKITITDEELKNDRYTGKFVYNEDIRQVMRVIAATTPIKYQIEGNVITISK